MPLRTLHFAWETVSILDAAERSIQPTKRAAKKEMERVSFLHKHICLYLQMAFSRGSIKSNLKANLVREALKSSARRLLLHLCNVPRER